MVLLRLGGVSAFGNKAISASIEVEVEVGLGLSLAKINFSTSRPHSNAKNFICQLFLKILILLLTTLPHKEFSGPLTWSKVAEFV